MRNLKKILALVLALVMSLSLMATAGAKDFTDKDDIDATGYQDAVDVLAELEIIRGYENGSFQPNGDITRAEVAAIVYRIATTDVGDTQADIYSSWGKFTDVKDGAWYAGYVNYCANAEIVKGTSATTFEPENRVTGYQVLAMILRTMGYGKNGEFEGASWAINTAAQAKKIGIIDNILEQKLGANATRAMVAEILFRAMLTEMVDYNALTGYQPNGKTLGQTQFGLEEITGVVMANEHADLEADKTLSKGKTRLDVDGKDYVLNVSTELTDIGESRTAFVRKTSQNSFNLLGDKLYGADDNVRVESGDELYASDIKALAKDAGLDITGAQHFENFDYATAGTSEWRIEYQVQFALDEETNDPDKISDKVTRKWFKDKYDVDPADVIGVKDTNRLDKVDLMYREITDEDGKVIDEIYYAVRYTRVIPMGDKITPDDIAIMKGVFSVASDDNHTSVRNVGVSGYVYAGTAKYNDQHDLSSELSWSKFYDEYIVNKASTTITYNAPGEWLKIVDNDGDGMAEYVFQTRYYAEQVQERNAKYGYLIFGYHDVETDELVRNIDVNPVTGQAVNYRDEVEVGDIVLAAWIDNKWQIEKAPEDYKVIRTVNYRDETVTTTEDDVYAQSGVEYGWHDLDKNILNMGEKVEYTVYFDHFGYVVGYTTEAAETSYALLSELYFNADRNSKYVKDQTAWAEITMGEAKTAEKVVTNVANLTSNVTWWFEGDPIEYTEHGTWYDYLQRAINHLGVANTMRRSINYLAGDEFKYGGKLTETNVAIYTYNEEKDTVELFPAAQIAKNRAGEQLFYSEYDENGNLKVLKTGESWTTEKITEAEYAKRYDLAMKKDGAFAALNNKWDVLKPVYSVDYVKLDVSKSIGGNQVRYDMDKADASWNEYGMNPGKNYQGNYVNATHATEYYVVSRGGDSDNSKITGITYYKGYEKLPKFDKADILAMYAVATNTNAARDGAVYWVADVIVIEANAVVASHDSVALAYYNPVKTTGDVKHLDALDNMTVDPQVDLKPLKATWAGQWIDYGFYALYDTEVNEPVVAAGRIDSITAKFNSYGVYAGTVCRKTTVLNEGEYVMVDKGDGVQTELFVARDVPVYGIATDGYTGWDLYELTASQLRTDDEIIYVYNKSGSALKYIVVANFHAKNYVEFEYLFYAGAKWVKDLWEAIIADQQAIPGNVFQIELNLAKDEVATITCGDRTYTYVGDAVEHVADVLRFGVSNPDKFEFTVKTETTLIKLDPPADYTFTNITTGDPTELTVLATTSKYNVGKSADTSKPAGAVGYTVGGVQGIVNAIMNANVDVGDDAKDSAGTISAETASDLFTKLLNLAANTDWLTATDGIEITIKDAEGKDVAVDLTQAFKTAAVGAKVKAIEAQYEANNDKPLSADGIKAITALLTTKVEEAVVAAADGEVDVAEVEEAAEAIAEVIADAVEAGVDLSGENLALEEVAKLTDAKNALKDAITKAEEELAKDLPEGVTEEDAKAAQDTLKKAIDAAKKALDAKDATFNSLDAAKTALDEAVKAYTAALKGEEPGTDTVDVTVKAGDGIKFTSASVGDDEADYKDSVYTIDKDAELTIVVVLTSGEDFTSADQIVVTSSDTTAAVEPKVTLNGSKAVTVVLPKAAADVTYTIKLKDEGSTT